MSQKVDIICKGKDCGIKFQGEHWKTHCYGCYDKYLRLAKDCRQCHKPFKTRYKDCPDCYQKKMDEKEEIWQKEMDEWERELTGNQSWDDWRPEASDIPAQ